MTMSLPLTGDKSLLNSCLEFLRKFDLLVIAALFLLLASLISVDRTIDFMIFCIFVLAYDLLYGYMGRLSFGHMLYLGVGAYALALSAEHLSGNPFLGLLMAVGSGAAVGLILGPIIVRTTGACFALINLAFNQVGFFLALVAFSKWTGGEDGMSTYFKKIWIIDFSKKLTVFFFALLCLILVIFLLRRLTSSLFGILLRGIKENETRVKFLGYNTFAVKMAAFVVSTSLSAFAGALFISSASTILANIGPMEMVKFPVRALYILVPVKSAGSRSGVNCMRENFVAIVFASTFIARVFARPGTPSRSTWPRASSPISRPFIMPSCPTITF